MNNQTTLLQGKPWTPSDMTDVQATWAKFGWKPRQKPSPKVNNSTLDLLDDYGRVERDDWLSPGGFR